MLNKSKSDYSLIKNKKFFIISKLERKDIPKYMNYKKLLFNEPSNFLKLPNELNINFIINKKNTIKENRLYRESNLSNNFIKMLPRRSTRLKSISSFSMKMKKALERKIINKSERNKKDINIELSKEAPNFVKDYINHNLLKQEKALKCQKDYNNIFKKIENNISKVQLRNSKSHNKDLKSIKNKTEHKFYESANLIKNSINNYRNKIEILKLDEKKKKKNLILENPIRNWQMSLRKPKIFNGIRKGYLNINSDKRPFWIMKTEKCPNEDEKIINPNINDKNNQTILPQNYIEKTNKKIFRRMKKHLLNLKKYNGLLVNGKKLIDFEEKQADDLKGNIKIVELSYDKNSIKDILIKMNCSINKYKLDKKDNEKMKGKKADI